MNTWESAGESAAGPPEEGPPGGVTRTGGNLISFANLIVAVSQSTRRDDELYLANDLLNHQLVDVAGVDSDSRGDPRRWSESPPHHPVHGS